MGGNQSTISPDEMAGATSQSSGIAPGRARESAGPSFTSPGESSVSPGAAFASPGESLAGANLFTANRRRAPAFASPSETSSRDVSLDGTDFAAPRRQRRNDPLPGGLLGTTPPMTGEDFASNGRMAKAMTLRSDLSGMAPIVRGAMRLDPDRAMVELADLSR